MARNKYPEETVSLILDVAQKLFLEKGYDNTSIQDIINGLGGLSKGAIYHHFKSKDEIMNAVSDRYNEQLVDGMMDVVKAKGLTGYQKLRRLFSMSLNSNNRDEVFEIAPNMLDNPRMLAMQVKEIFDVVSPQFVQPVIEQGIADGSIKTQYPKQVAEAMLILANVWMNPLVVNANAEDTKARVQVFTAMLKGVGIDLADEEMIDGYVRFCSVKEERR
ncbi:MAG: TetR/AcrR family transcriptional regulator [Clostridia bacterium]|nr:TetR/AcrR family transcriptional regulator [Clostridia bacterium]NLS84843.1 TetR/AcrR family transcriptional regulator [Oscillospiraceae bacterium]